MPGTSGSFQASKRGPPRRLAGWRVFLSMTLRAQVAVCLHRPEKARASSSRVPRPALLEQEYYACNSAVYNGMGCSRYHYALSRCQGTLATSVTRHDNAGDVHGVALGSDTNPPAPATRCPRNDERPPPGVRDGRTTSQGFSARRDHHEGPIERPARGLAWPDDNRAQ